ncbi:MAG: biopolymer transporter ExbD [Chromatiales bacterium]|nr:biopolymer transporter ExbD [Chromatiales bacterium]
MRLPGPPPRRDEEPVLALVNVVFLLLVFLVVAGSLTEDSPIVVQPPVSARAASPEAPRPRLRIDADGRIALDASVLALDELAAALAAEPPTASLVVAADAGVEAGRVLAVMDVLRAAGVRRLDLVVAAGGG